MKPLIAIMVLYSARLYPLNTHICLHHFALVVISSLITAALAIAFTYFFDTNGWITTLVVAFLFWYSRRIEVSLRHTAHRITGSPFFVQALFGRSPFDDLAAIIYLVLLIIVLCNTSGNVQSHFRGPFEDLDRADERTGSEVAADEVFRNDPPPPYTENASNLNPPSASRGSSSGRGTSSRRRRRR